MSADDYALAIITEGLTPRPSGATYLQHPVISPRGIQIALATVYVESDFVMYANAGDPDSLNYPHTAVSTDANSDGLFQQRAPWWGTVGDRMDPALSAAMFYHDLAGLNYNDPNSTPGSFAQAVQQSAYPDRYDQRFTDAVAMYDRLITPEGIPAVTPAVPCDTSYNEYPRWCNNNEGRGGTKVDLFLLHTEEGDSNADGLASFLISTEGGANPVSYHYTISEAADKGVTVCDVVDTAYASWSVMASNDRSINLCFAGSYAAWTRDQWLQQANAIDVAAFLCVQDCVKYGINPKVIAPPYSSPPPGISDHRYCTQYLKDGNTHTDVGDNFPWDVFAAAVAKYSATPLPAPTPAPPVGPTPVGPADDQLTLRWHMLGDQTIVEALAELRDKVLGTSDRSKQGAV